MDLSIHSTGLGLTLIKIEGSIVAKEVLEELKKMAYKNIVFVTKIKKDITVYNQEYLISIQN